MTKDESALITGDDGNRVIVWDMSSGERMSTLAADGGVRCCASCGGALWCVDCGCGAGAERVGLALWSPILRQAGRRSASGCACCRVCGWWCAVALGKKLNSRPFLAAILEGCGAIQTVKTYFDWH